MAKLHQVNKYILFIISIRSFLFFRGIYHIIFNSCIVDLLSEEINNFSIVNVNEYF